MTNRKLSKLIAFINLLVVAILTTDNYLLPASGYGAAVKNKTQEFTTGRRGYYTYFITDQDAVRYNVPVWCYNRLETGDSFTVIKTGLFKKVIKIEYDYKDGYRYTNHIGVINQTSFGIFVLALISVVSILLAVFPGILKNEMVALRTSILISWVTLVAIFFYFHYQA